MSRLGHPFSRAVAFSRGALLSLAGIIVLAGLANAQTPGFVQGRFATPQTPQTSVTLAYSSAQTAGNLNVVAVGFYGGAPTILSVSDSSGNAYALAAGPTIGPSTSVHTQAIYYAPNILGAANNAVTVTFDAAADYPDIRIAEYSGLAATAPLEAGTGATGVGTLADSGNLATTAPQTLLVGATTVQKVTTGPGPGYTQRLLTSPNGSILMDRVVSSAGTYNATANTTGGGWVIQLAAFRASDNPLPPPGAGPLPPLGPGQNYVVFPGGQCAGMVEIGTWKPEINQFWTRSPRVFIETCSVMALDTWPARYRLAARCVNRQTKTAISPWVRADSTLGNPWPQECTQWTPAPPALGTPPQP